MALPIETFLDFPQFLYVNAGILTYLKTCPLPFYILFRFIVYLNDRSVNVV